MANGGVWVLVWFEGYQDYVCTAKIPSGLRFRRDAGPPGGWPFDFPNMEVRRPDGQFRVPQI